MKEEETSIPANEAAAEMALEPPVEEEPDIVVDPEDDGKAQQRHTIDFLQDHKQDMSYSRRLALYLMEKYEWYHPKRKEEAEKDEADLPPEYQKQFDEQGEYRSKDGYPMSYSTCKKPSLEKAWAYRDHVVISRFLQGDKDRSSGTKKSKELQMAEPGENKYETRMYHPLFTPHKQLGDWGLGIGLYFSTIRGVMVITFVVGLLNIVSMIYYRSGEYKGEWDPDNIDSALLRGSAICMDFPLEICPTCTEENQPPGNYFFGVRDNSTAAVMFVYRTTCNGATWLTSMINYASMFLILIGYIILRQYLRKTEVEFDEDEQTAQDYSIEVFNIPPDAKDPEEWRQFFEKNLETQVTACTVAVDNDLLVRALFRRRELMRKLEMRVDPGTSLDMETLGKIASDEESERSCSARLLALASPGVPEMYKKVLKLTEQIRELAKTDYIATTVFITFETEADQRKVLSLLTVPTIDAWQNNKAKAKDQKHLFRGEYMLDVREPEEPNTIRWEDLNAKFHVRVLQQAFTLGVTFVLVVVVSYIVRWVRRDAALATQGPIAIAVCDAVFSPVILTMMGYEYHPTESEKETSLYVKLTIFRLVNYAILLTAVTPFVELLIPEKLGPIPQVFALFWSEIVTSNAMALGDPVGQLQRHYLAPRAKSQDEMDLLMRGSATSLANLYTNITKLIFFACWYSAIYPAGFLVCAMALFINYTRNKFALTRTWERPPRLGERIAHFGGAVFPPLALIAMSVMGSFFWASFPMDNLCATNATAGSEFAGEWRLAGLTTYSFYDIPGFTEVDFEDVNETQTVDQDDIVYEFCQQNFFEFHGFPFVGSRQPEGAEWMTDEQEAVTNLFGWTSVAIVVGAALFVVYLAKEYVAQFFVANYKPRGEDKGINFSSVPMMSAYVPQLKSSVFPHPLFAVNVDGIDDSIVDWTDSDRPYSFYDLTRDADVILKDIDVGSNTLFSTVTHWIPESRVKPKDD